MPRRELFTAAERAELIAFPPDEGDLIRLATLSRSDLAYIRQHRGDHNRLGLSVLMVYLRFPSRVLAPGERPYAPLVGIIAAQLNILPAVWDLYATRDETRREHLQELLARLQLRQFDREHYKALSDYLLPVAMQTTRTMVLARSLVTELRSRRVLLPTGAVIEALCGAVLTRAQRATYRQLTASLTVVHRAALDALLVVPSGESTSPLAWLRQPPGAPSANAVLAHLARLHAIRDLKLPADLGRDVHQNRLLRLSREGTQSAVFQLLDHEPVRRYATLVAILMDATATLTDETLELHDRLIGTFFNKAKHRYEQAFSADGRALNDKVRLYAKVGAALIAAKTDNTDPFVAIEAILPWEQFIASVDQAEQLSRDEAFDALTLVTNYFSTLRKYAPLFLKAFEFRGAPSAQGLLAAIATLRTMNESGARKVPPNAPIAFVPPRWARSVGTGDHIDRQYYEFCALSELKNRLRAGDIYVAGSRQFKDFEDYLLPPAVFTAQQREHRLGLNIPTDAKAYLAERMESLRAALDETNRLAASDALPDARLDKTRAPCLADRG